MVYLTIVQEVKIADSVLLSLFMRDSGKCNISHAPRLGRYSILNTKCIGVIDHEGQEKILNRVIKILFMSKGIYKK